METEIWAPVVGYESIYTVSTWGRVRINANRHNIKYGSMLAQTPTVDGYLMVRLNRNVGIKPTGSTHAVSRLVYEAFKGPIPDGKQIDHVNGNKIDNRLENLEAVTSAINNQRAVARGGRCGERNGSTKLTAAQVVTIRERACAGDRFDHIARDYNVSGVLVMNIAYGKNWKNAGGPITEKRGRIGRPRLLP